MNMTRYRTCVCVIAAFAFPVHGPDAAAADDRSTDAAASFHHVRLNAKDPQASIAWYRKFFGAVPVRFRDVSDAVLTDRCYFLFNQVPQRAPDNSQTSLWHVGWGGVDGQAEFEWRTEQGIEWQTPITEVGTANGPFHFMYAHGPDREVVEVWTGARHHRYNHIHLLAEDVNATAAWYVTHLGAKPLLVDVPRPGPPPANLKVDDPKANLFPWVWMTMVQVDGVSINIFSRPDDDTFWWTGEPIPKFEPTDGHVINHFAFSYPNIDPVYERMKSAGVKIVRDTAWNEQLRMKSFFIRAPDGVLLEIVEADPLPRASWIRHVRPPR